MIAVLYCDPRGEYSTRAGVDLWDERRDARGYCGPWPVVAHPPCARWCMLARLVEARYGHRVGDDGGCFLHALVCVEEFGGVLEHPAGSLAFKACGLAKPRRGSWQRSREGWLTSVSQVAYGHRCRKRTWLYYVGPTPPALNWLEPRATHQISRLNVTLPVLAKREASRTPAAFADVLLGLAAKASRTVAPM